MSEPAKPPRKVRLTAPPERRFLVGLILLLAGMGLTQLMTFNQLTQIGWALVWITLIGGLLGLLLGLPMKRAWLQHLGNGLLLLFLLIAALLQFSLPRPEAGSLIDTTEAHRRHHRVEAVGGAESRAGDESRWENPRP